VAIGSLANENLLIDQANKNNNRRQSIRNSADEQLYPGTILKLVIWKGNLNQNTIAKK
jgi:hypothetical protein